MPRLGAVLVGIAWGAVACGPSQEAVEASRVARAIDSLRDAPSDPIESRRKLLDDLEAQRATAPLSARARDACTAAYRPLLEGAALEASVRSRMSSDPASVDPAVVRDLAEAEAKVEKSRAAMPACDTAVADLKRRAR